MAFLVCSINWCFQMMLWLEYCRRIFQLNARMKSELNRRSNKNREYDLDYWKVVFHYFEVNFQHICALCNNIFKHHV
jgi:hypothetical protein